MTDRGEEGGVVITASLFTGNFFFNYLNSALSVSLLLDPWAFLVHPHISNMFHAQTGGQQKTDGFEFTLGVLIHGVQIHEYLSNQCFRE